MFQITVEDVKPSKKRLHIEVPAENVLKKEAEIVGNIGKTANIKGFRKGKVPKDIIMKTYKKDIEEDTKRELMSTAYEFAISEHKLNPVSNPAFTSVVYEKDKPFSFDASVDVKPQFDLKEYKNIPIEKEGLEVTQDEIEKAIKQLQEAFSSLEDKDGTVKDEDIVVLSINSINKHTNAPIKEFSGENLYIEMGKKQLIEEIEKEIYGAKAGDEKIFDVKFDNDYPLRFIKGKDITFDLKIKSVKKKNPPELDDKFAQKVNKEFKTFDDLKKDVETKLLENKKNLEVNRQKDKIVNYLLNEYDFELPESLVNQEASNVIVEYVKNMYYSGADVNTEEYKPANLRKRFVPEAEKRVKSTFILLAIGNKEKIDVSSDEIKKAISDEAVARKTSFENLYKEYEEKNLLPIVEMDILGDKVLDFLYENSITAKQKESGETDKKQKTEE